MVPARCLVMLPLSLMLLTNVTAHGGENGGGMSNVQVLISSLIGAIIVFLSAGKISKFELRGNQRLILTLAFFTGIPTMFFVNSDGLIESSMSGIKNKSIIEAYWNDLQ